MIRVEGLTRRFGRLLAIDDLNFSIEEGEVVGLLGLNGAGKSTTMRILAGVLAAHAGRGFVDNVNVEEVERLGARVGYLPERPPLYPEMRMGEYLAFAARIRGVEVRGVKMDALLQRLGLQGMESRILGRLSKGYQQRVGLAQAMIHDPKVLILDEPSSGLDPAQRLEIRGLIKELADSGRTLILSTHLLEEVEASCKRVLVLHKGRLVADEAVDAQRCLELRVSGSSEAALAALQVVEPSTILVSEGCFHCPTDADRGQLAQVLIPFGLQSLRTQRGLQDRFFQLTLGSEREAQ
jgi:ABC-2 type transport system ATP-binding protein